MLEEGSGLALHALETGAPSWFDYLLLGCLS